MYAENKKQSYSVHSFGLKRIGRQSNELMLVDVTRRDFDVMMTSFGESPGTK